MLRFGTDGVRGHADDDLTPRLVRALGKAAGAILGNGRPFLVGRDTRASGPRLVADLAAGLAASDVAIVDLGVVPTPAVAAAAHHSWAPAAMISASHNPWFDNGIKLFAPGGAKLDDEVEQRIEDELARTRHADTEIEALLALPDPDPAWLDAYVTSFVAVIEPRRLEGLSVIVDAANGAAFEAAPRALRLLGAQVVAIHAAPDGHNINEACGSTHPEDLRRAVVAAGADAGLAFDGDADRLIAVDERGEVVDGDAMMLVAALDLRDQGRLRNDGVAVTVMSNLGLRQALTDAGITVVTTPVGDRSIGRAMSEHDLSLGGEQSGHIIFADHASTGDGLLTAVMLLDAMRRNQTPLSSLTARLTRYPQILENVRLDRPVDLARATAVWDEVARVEAELGDQGRVLVRVSGTEPVVRVMAEAAERTQAERAVERVVASVTAWTEDADSGS